MDDRDIRRIRRFAENAGRGGLFLAGDATVLRSLVLDLLDEVEQYKGELRELAETVRSDAEAGGARTCAPDRAGGWHIGLRCGDERARALRLDTVAVQEGGQASWG